MELLKKIIKPKTELRFIKDYPPNQTAVTTKNKRKVVMHCSSELITSFRLHRSARSASRS